MIDDIPERALMTARPSRLLTFVSIVLVALWGVQPDAATAASLGGVVSGSLTARYVSRTDVAPHVYLADSFTTAGAVDARVPESVGGPATWVQVRGKWAVRNGYLDPPQLPGALVLFPVGLAVATAEVGVTITSAYQFGPVLRSNPGGTSYLSVQLSSSNTMAVVITVAGSSTTVYSQTSGQGWVSPTGVFTFGATLRNTAIDILVNGAVVRSYVFTASDLALLQQLNGFTAAGVWVSSSGNEMLDDVRVSSPL